MDEVGHWRELLEVPDNTTFPDARISNDFNQGNRVKSSRHGLDRLKFIRFGLTLETAFVIFGLHSLSNQLMLSIN